MSTTQIRTVKGEAAVSVRKGKKIISYDYALAFDWKIELLDSDKKTVVCECTGSYELPEVTNEEDMSSWEVRPSVTKDE